MCMSGNMRLKIILCRLLLAAITGLSLQPLRYQSESWSQGGHLGLLLLQA